MVTNFFVFNFLKTLLGSRIRDLLIKSQAFLVHRRVQQSTTDTILRLNAKTVSTGQNKLGPFWGLLPPFPEAFSLSNHVVHRQDFNRAVPHLICKKGLNLSIFIGFYYGEHSM